MNKKFKIAILSTLGIAVCAMSDVAFAQVFAPRTDSASARNASPVATQTKPYGVRPNVQKNQQMSSATNTVTSPAASTTTDVAPAVKKNFSGIDEKKEYNNSSPKVVSFKIVNGEVVLDEDKERSILVYYDNYQVHRGLDDYVRCSLRIYVLNDLTEKISSLGFKLYWPQISTSVQMNQLNQGVRTYKDIMLMGDGCFNIDSAPTIEVNRCRVKGMSQEKCADAVKWYDKNK